VLKAGEKYGYFEVEFLKTGHVGEYRKDAIIKGEIRDKYANSFLGIGIIGNVRTRGKNKRLYTVWRNMMRRCYNPDLPSASSYFGKVAVCERWHLFENFLGDVLYVDGWNKELFEKGLIVLDKDKKQRFAKRKLYSLETCTWLSQEENSKYQDFQQRRFMAISPLGEEFVDYNITDFARVHGLERRQISSVLHGRYKTSLGWRFEFLDT
jgi:hypothetical protein